MRPHNEVALIPCGHVPNTSTRSVCPSISAEPPSSPPQPNRCLRRHENSRVSRIPSSLLTARVHRVAASLATLSRTQPPQKRYRTVNQEIPEVADDSRLRGDNARNAIGPDVRFSRTSTSPLEGSPASKAASTPARSPSSSPTAASIAVTPVTAYEPRFATTYGSNARRSMSFLRLVFVAQK